MISSKSLTRTNYSIIISKTFTSGQEMQKFILLLFILASLVQVGCTKSNKPSVLIIAADQLMMMDVSCNQDDEKIKSGFHVLCKESVRFTHAFTPSPLSVPALTSVLTGLYPYQHKVRTNGGPGLAPEFISASEAALKQGYRTSFFSGGAPAFRRSGLNQGFELFDDNISPSFKSLFRPFKKSSEIFLNWLKQEVDSDPFLSVIYAPDLLFTTTQTTTPLGEPRNLTFESQIDELDENLFDLFQALKNKNRWEDTTIVLMGLNGHSDNDRRNEIAPLNLHSENTQVALLIKPAQNKKRDEAIHWKIDQNVSLVDIGKTLFEIFHESIIEDSSTSFPTHSLLGLLKNTSNTWNEGRPLLIESSWATWRKQGSTRVAAIADYVLYIHDERPLLYNTIVDRLESTPLPLLQESVLPTTLKLQNLILKNQFPIFTLNNKDALISYSLPYARWMRVDQEALLLQDLKQLTQRNPQNLVFPHWTAQIALRQKDWETLRQLGQKNKIFAWQWVAERNLQNKSTKITDSCFNLLTASNLETDNLKQCADPFFLELVDWLRADSLGLSKETQRKRFERSFKNFMLDQQIERANIAAGMIWDTSSDNLFSPSRVELALHLPEYAKVRTQLYKSLQTEEPTD